MDKFPIPAIQHDKRRLYMVDSEVKRLYDSYNWNDTIFHSACRMFPRMAEEEFAALVSSMAEGGYDNRFPIITLGDLILDGRNRYFAAQAAGVQPTTAEAPDGCDPFKYVLDIHDGRRNLTAIQRGLIRFEGLKQSEAFQSRLQAAREQAREARAAALEARRDTGTGQAGAAPVVPRDAGTQDTDTPAMEPKDKNITAALYAEELGISRAQTERVMRIAKRPELAAAVVAGSMKAEEALRKISVEQQREALESTAALQAKAIEGVFDVIIMDPPWPIEKIARDVSPEQNLMPYPTMTLEEIGALKVPAADNCHVFVWTTQKYLPATFALLNKWGLKYNCVFTWHKDGGFKPYGEPMFNSEFVVYARKGSPVWVDEKDFKTSFTAPRGVHSAKPDAFYNMIRRVTAGRRLDMFNRRKIEGFEVWGKEAAG